MEQCKASTGHVQPDDAADEALVALESTFIEFFQEGQAQERRRITQEIHDSTMQLLNCLGLALSRLKQPHRPKQNVEIIAEMESLLSEAQSELRTFSYLAHPPSLEALGLHDALQILIDGFGRRSGLKADLFWHGERSLADHAIEMALYRVIQEGLSNVHRHARAAHVVVTVTSGSECVEVSVTDDGMGMPEYPSYGVGLSGMRARLNDVGGYLTIRQASPGTEVVATTPAERQQHRDRVPSARSKLLQLCASCHRIADNASDERISAALREMAGQFDAMAGSMGLPSAAPDFSPSSFVPAVPLGAGH